MFWLEPREAALLQELSLRRGCTMKEAVVYALQAATARERIETQWHCDRCSWLNEGHATCCPCGKQKVQKLPVAT